MRVVEAEVVSQHANITAWMARLEALPGVKEYVESRPEAGTKDPQIMINE